MAGFRDGRFVVEDDAKAQEAKKVIGMIGIVWASEPLKRFCRAFSYLVMALILAKLQTVFQVGSAAIGAVVFFASIPRRSIPIADAILVLLVIGVFLPPLVAAIRASF